MSEKDNGLNWFWNTVMVLLAALAIFGGFVTLKLLRSAAPSVERVINNSNRLVEQNTEVETKPTTATTTTVKGVSFVVENINLDTWDKLGRTDTEEVDEDDWEENQETPAVLEEQPAAPLAAEEQSPVAQEFSYTLEEMEDRAAAPKKKAAPAAKPVVKPVPVLLSKNYSYQEGLVKCVKENLFPCKWRNYTQGFQRRYQLNSIAGPVERITYTQQGAKLSRTLSTLEGSVLYYQGAFAELYFVNGQLVRIRTFPYENPNLRDWFVIDNTGRLSTCLCGMPSQNCCARSLLYREGGHRKYCELFPRDADFCSQL